MCHTDLLPFLMQIFFSEMTKLAWMQSSSGKLRQMCMLGGSGTEHSGTVALRSSSALYSASSWRCGHRWQRLISQTPIVYCSLVSVRSAISTGPAVAFLLFWEHMLDNNKEKDTDEGILWSSQKKRKLCSYGVFSSTEFIWSFRLCMCENL